VEVIELVRRGIGETRSAREGREWLSPIVEESSGVALSLVVSILVLVVEVVTGGVVSTEIEATSISAAVMSES
jgi:hypothetical protein